jgi:hypothetical protein
MRDTLFVRSLYDLSLVSCFKTAIVILCFIAFLFLGIFYCVKILIPCNFKILWLLKLNIYSKALQLLRKTVSKVINVCDKSLGNYTWSSKQFLIAAMGCFQKLMRMGRSRFSYHACFLYRFVKCSSSPINSLYI